MQITSHQFKIAVLFSIILSTNSNAQDPIYSVDQIKSDFRLFRQALEESHPGLYRYRNKQEMTQRFDEAYAKLVLPMSELAFFKNLAPIISALGCGHTSVRLSEKFQANHKLQLLLPFEFRFVDGKAIIVKSYLQDADVVAGSELLSIDGASMQSIAATIIPFMNGDGFITTSKYRALEQYFSRLLRVYIKESDSYRVTVKTKTGKEIEKEVKVIAASDIRQPETKPALELKMLSDQTAILTIRSFGSGITDAAGTNYAEFLSNSFKTLVKQKVQNLIIDLRGNGGGRDDYGALLFSYLTAKPFMYYSYLEMKPPTLSFLKYTGRPESFRTELEADLIRASDGRYLYKESAHPCLPLQSAQAVHFDRDVYILIDGRSFSATAEFASIARYKKRALFVGEETGGAYEGNTSGGGVELILPETKIKVIIPLTKYVCAVELDPKLKGRGITPDVEVKPTLEGLISGKDEGLSKVLQLTVKN